jgi:hypothetical protein
LQDVSRRVTCDPQARHADRALTSIDIDAATRDEPVHARADVAVSIVLVVEHHDGAPAAPEHERSRDTGRPSSDDHCIDARLDHEISSMHASGRAPRRNVQGAHTEGFAHRLETAMNRSSSPVPASSGAIASAER